jgi:cobalamin-dependent methionine synthase I
VNEAEVMKKVVMELQSIVAAPLQIDSADPAVIGQALRLYDGIAIVNSVNAKEESLEAVLPLVKKYGACVSLNHTRERALSLQVKCYVERLVRRLVSSPS